MAATVSTAPRARSAGVIRMSTMGAERAIPSAKVRPGTGVILGPMTEHDVAAHGMGQHHDGARGFGHHQPLQEQVEVLEKVVVADDVTLTRILQHPAGAALAAPVQRVDGEAAGPEVAHGLAVFLDELGPALQQHHRSPPAAGRRGPDHRAEREAVVGGERP